MTPDYNVNANINECIKAVNYIGHTTYMNICNGASSDVPWGTMTWIVPPLFLAIMGAVCYWSFYVLDGPSKRG